jgi:type I restriction enzyme S subunit
MTKDLAPYPAYKPSGVGWIESLPKHWQLRRGNWLFRKMDRPVRTDPTHIPIRPVGAGLKPAPTCNRIPLTIWENGLMSPSTHTMSNADRVP